MYSPLRGQHAADGCTVDGCDRVHNAYGLYLTHLRISRGEPTGPLNRTADGVRAIREAREVGMTLKAIAEKFDCSLLTLCGIVTRSTLRRRRLAL